MLQCGLFFSWHATRPHVCPSDGQGHWDLARGLGTQNERFWITSRYFPRVIQNVTFALSRPALLVLIDESLSHDRTTWLPPSDPSTHRCAKWNPDLTSRLHTVLAPCLRLPVIAVHSRASPAASRALLVWSLLPLGHSAAVLPHPLRPSGTAVGPPQSQFSEHARAAQPFCVSSEQSLSLRRLT